MPDLSIRGVPPELHRQLREEAKETHRSITSIVLEALAEHAEERQRRRRLQSIRREMDALRASMPLTSDSAELLREDRER